MLTISEAAVKKLQVLIAEEPATTGLRVYVKGGGCHGYQYGMSMEIDPPTDDDTVIETEGVKVIIDPQSAGMLVGAVVDYVDSLQGAGFAIKNPAAKTTCGCGSSFSS